MSDGRFRVLSRRGKLLAELDEVTRERDEARTLVGRAYLNIEQGCKCVAWMLDAKEELEAWATVGAAPEPSGAPTEYSDTEDTGDIG